MHITLPKRVLKRMSDDQLDMIGWSSSHYIRTRKYVSVSLKELGLDKTRQLRDMLVEFKRNRARMLNPMIADIDRWIKVVEEGASGDEVPTTLHQFADLMVQYLLSAPKQWVYEQRDNGMWVPYYVNSVHHHAERPATRDRSYHPAHIDVNLIYFELGGTRRRTVTWRNEDVDGKTVVSALAALGLLAEEPDMLEQYEAHKARYDEIAEQVGRQMWVTGRSEDADMWDTGYTMARDGNAGKCVIDVVGADLDKHMSNARIETNFWDRARPTAVDHIDSEFLSMNAWGRHEQPPAPMGEPEIPLHANVPIYHLWLHRRYRVHVTNLHDYAFNKQLDRQLVLPDDTKQLVDTLVGQGRVAFKDIIEGKASGAVVLLGGPPGVGKTLTAEVFAESTERPLLSVHAAQLGISADLIESNLNTYLKLGNRWNAVVLIDEADVYIAERGHDLAQNATRGGVPAGARIHHRHRLHDDQPTRQRRRRHRVAVLGADRLPHPAGSGSDRHLANPQPHQRNGTQNRRHQRYRGPPQRPERPRHQTTAQTGVVVVDRPRPTRHRRHH